MYSMYICALHIKRLTTSCPFRAVFSCLGSDIAPPENVHLSPKDQVASSKKGWGVSPCLLTSHTRGMTNISTSPNLHPIL